MSRLIRDKKGVYDLAAVVALGMYTQPDRNGEKGKVEECAILHLASGGAVHSDLLFLDVLNEWQNYLANPDVPNGLGPILDFAKDFINKQLGKFAATEDDFREVEAPVAPAATTVDAAPSESSPSPPTN